jgi:hypothetical protein
VQEYTNMYIKKIYVKWSFSSCLWNNQ